jgi:hypothetical protein
LSPPSIWQTLGIDPTRDPQQIRRAYARRLKSTNPEDDSEGFKVLRAAYEQALIHIQRAGPAPSAEGAAPRAASSGGGPAEGRPSASPPSDAKTHHVATCRRLAALFQASPPPDPEALDQALEAVLSSPALEEIGVRVDTDRWLVQLIAHNQPRSDPLLDKTIARFGWNDRAIGRKDAGIIRWLLQRQSDRAFLRQLESSGNARRWAFDALRRPPRLPGILERLRGRDRSAEAGVLLTEIRKSHPTIIGDLDPAILAAWDEYLSRPKLSPKELRVVAAAPVALAGLGITQLVEWPNRGYAVVIEIPLLLLLCIPATILVRFHGIAWPRWHWDRRPASRQPPWLGLGWAPAALLLLTASAVTPPVIPAVAAAAVLATGVVFWILITGRPDRGALPALSLKVAGFLVLCTLLWWTQIAHVMVVTRYVAMSAALAAGIVASIAGANPLVGLWYGRLHARHRALGMLALLALTAGAGTLLWLATRQPSLASLAAAAVIGLVLVSRPISIGLAARTGRWIHVVMLSSGAVALGRSIHDTRVALPLGGAWLLACVALTFGALLAAQRRERRADEGA